MRICPNCETPTLESICPYDAYQTVDAALYMDPHQDPFVGTVFHDRYRIEARLAMGGMSTVYRATQLAVGRPVALKILTRELARDLKAVARFQQEARAVAGLRHPNTIRLYDYGQSKDGHLFLVMEFLDGETLGDVIDREAPFEPQRVVRIAKQLFDALGEAHGLGIVHRDLKPDNIFLTSVGLQDNYVKILDFGIAKVTKLEGRKGLTGTGLVIGSPGYMAPEQVQAQPSTAQTDIYAIGALTYEMLTGAPIFEGESAIELAFKHVQDRPPAPAIEGRQLQGPLVDFVMRCLAKSPDARPPSAAAALHELQAMEQAPLRAGLIPDPRSTSPGLGASLMQSLAQAESGAGGRRESQTTDSYLDAVPEQDLGSSSASYDDEPFDDEAWPPQPRSKTSWLAAVLVLVLLAGGAAWWYTQVYSKPHTPPVSLSASVASPDAQALTADTTPSPKDAASQRTTKTSSAPAPDAGPQAAAPPVSPDATRTPKAVADSSASGPEVSAKVPDANVADTPKVETQWVELVSIPAGAKVFVKRAAPAEHPKGAAKPKFKKVGVTPYRLTWNKGETPPRVMLKKTRYEIERKRLRSKDHGRTIKFRMEYDDSW